MVVSQDPGAIHFPFPQIHRPTTATSSASSSASSLPQQLSAAQKHHLDDAEIQLDIITGHINHPVQQHEEAEPRSQKNPPLPVHHQPQVQLQIPDRRVLPPTITSGEVQNPWWSRLFNLCLRQFARPTIDQLRWPVQVGVSAGITFCAIALVDPVLSFFGPSIIIGVISVLFPVEATSGAVLRRAWLSVTPVIFGCCLSYALFVLSTWNGNIINKWYASVFMNLSAIFLTVPFAIFRQLFPRHSSGIPIGIAMSENALLSTFTAVSTTGVLIGALTTPLAVSVGVFCATIIAHLVLAKKARPHTLMSLSIIVSAMADILEPLTKMTVHVVNQPGGSSALLLSSYQQLLTSANQLVTVGDLQRASQNHQEQLPRSLSSEETKKSTELTFLSQLDIDRQNAATSPLSTPLSVKFQRFAPTSAKTIRKTTEDKSVPVGGTSLLERMMPNMEQCDKMLKTINRCQGLLSKQADLVDAAKVEVSCRKPHKFPAKAYCQILAEVRTLFVHVASLVVALNLHFSSVAYNAKLVDTKLSAIQKLRSFVLKKPSRSKSQMPTRFLTTTEFRHGRFFRALPLSLSQSHSYVPSFSQATFGNESCAPYETTFVDLTVAAQHIAKALMLLSECISNRGKTSSTRMEISYVTQVINEMEAQRAAQRESFADIIFTVLEADVTGNWSPKGGNSNQLDWKGALGIDGDVLRKFTEQEILMYCDAYWLARDRVSTSSQTLHVLREGLLRCCDLLDVFVEINPKAPVFHLIP